MNSIEIIKHIEQWTPKEIAWQKDNVGLQVGSLKRNLSNIMLCLDVDEKVINYAIQKKCNLIISHHPLLFYPMKKIDVGNDSKSALVEMLIKKDISVYSMHTNFDYSKEGVSFQLAKALKLKNIKFLKNLNSNQFKLVVFVPRSSLEKVSKAVFNAGAGSMGEYSNCSFSTEGTGTFQGSEKSNPAIGKKNNFEKVDEARFEVFVNSWKLPAVISAMKQAHPYEEVAYDIYPLLNVNVDYGIGAYGELDRPMTQKEFLDHTSNSLKIKNFRFSGNVQKKLSRIAVCGGSGSEYVNDAIKLNCDAYVTADVKYHTFQENEKEILLVDAGHYETEIISLKEIETRLTGFLKGKSNKVFRYNGSTNPILFYNK
jgi:dinuclear metal center YbgI/SA1388 family protein